MRYSFKRQVYINWKGQITESLTKYYVKDVLVPKLEKEGWDKVLFHRISPFMRMQELKEIYPIEVAIVDFSSRLDSFSKILPEGYKILSHPSKSRYFFILNKSGQSTLIYSWEIVRPVTPRKSASLIDKLHYKRKKIDNKVLLARKFSVKTKKLASEVKNLALVEAEPSKPQADVEGNIGDHLLLSLLLKKLRSPPSLQISERKWQRKLTRKYRYVVMDFLSERIYPNQELLRRYERINDILKHSPDGFLLKLRNTGEVKLMKEAVSELGEGSWKLSTRNGESEFSTEEADETMEIPIVNGEIEVVEVKSDKGKLTKAQKEEYSNLVRNGYPLRLIHVSIISFVKNQFEVNQKLFRTVTEIAQATRP